MKTAAHFLFWGAAAVGLHLVAATWVFRDNVGGMDAAGDGGTATITIVSAGQNIVDLVAEWETPPQIEIAPQLPDFAAPVFETNTPVNSVTPAPVAPPAPTAPVNALPLPNTPDIATQPSTPQRPSVNMATADDPRPAARPTNLMDRPDPAPSRPAPAPQPPSAPNISQTASGSGGGANAGATANDAPAVSNAERASAMANWGARIRNAVERRKRVPSNARGVTGRVVLTLSVSRTGTLQSVSIKESSGNAALDQAAVSAAQSARYRAAPDALTDPVYSFNLPIAFE
ncbi:hypothetical protein BVC71_12420 [Marivivens niveibacter]|uniref:TonB C-terminal domain-containing protein n=1 Tax=Marivivens niveibacter TaxID=1930667 RepID=A0A251WWA9_9RHOB|nr:TonB family protein [Marivivens niveibacter]OUD08727.1 hypothetical protein BVC71_12420 [Marivivens niveibacter]